MDSTAVPPSETLLHSQPRRADVTLLTPSARTSYTRVDLSAADVGTGGAGGVEEDQEEVDEPSEDDGENLTVEAGGPSALDVESTIPHMPQVSLTFLLVSGRRRTMSFDHEITIGRVKELVWNGWPNEWQDERPPAPSYLRILYLGKMLQDDDGLIKLGFPTFIPTSSTQGQASRPSTPPQSTIVHLSIRSYAPPGDEGLKKKGRRRTTAEGGPESEGPGGFCCGCVIC